jgi:hypothetical protein
MVDEDGEADAPRAVRFLSPKQDAAQYEQQSQPMAGSPLKIIRGLLKSREEDGGEPRKSPVPQKGASG